jgi:hypothetical protein
MDTLSNKQKRGDLILASALFVLMTGRYGWDSQTLMGDFFNSERNTWYDNRNARLKSAALNTSIILLTCVLISDKTNGKNLFTGDSWIQLSNKSIDHDNTFMEGLVQIIDNLRNIKTSYGIQGLNYSDALLLAQELENALLVGVNVFALAVEKLNAQMILYDDKDLWVDDEDLEMLKKGLKGEIGNINWLADNVFYSELITSEKMAQIQYEIMRDGIEHDGGRKKYSLKKRITNKLSKRVANKLQIAGGKAELEKKLRELNDSLTKLREIDTVNPNQWNDEAMTYTMKEIDKIRFQLKTPEEQEAIIERQKIARLAAKQRQQELEEQRERNRKELEEQKLEQTRQEQESLKRFTAKMYEDARRQVNQWEQENQSRLRQDKSFVRAEYEKLQTQYETITAHGQPKGAAAFAGYPIWYQLMVDLLKKYL